MTSAPSSDIQVAGLSQRLSKRRLSLRVTEAARQHLARCGYDPAFGARPLKRLIQRSIGDPLAIELLAGRYDDDDVVTVDVAGPAGGDEAPCPDAEAPGRVEVALVLR